MRGYNKKRGVADLIRLPYTETVSMWRAGAVRISYRVGLELGLDIVNFFTAVRFLTPPIRTAHLFAVTLK